jgi:hypothetical protein
MQGLDSDYINHMWNIEGSPRISGELACSICGEVTPYKKRIVHKVWCPTLQAQREVLDKSTKVC